MNKDEILKLLKENTENFISGEKISEKLGITRSGVWKSIKALRNEGYFIESVTNKGYRLKNNIFHLCEPAVRAYLGSSKIASTLYFYNTVTSTFDKLSEFKPSEGLTVLAANQSNGRGRLGRNWSSDLGGIYFSFLLLPPIDAKAAPFVTLICALGVYKALSKYIECTIKWPNDIVHNGKKICGILTKTTLCESDIEHIAVGIGVNVNNTEFDSELSFATSLKLICGHNVDENKLFSEIITQIDYAYYHMDKNDVLNEYKDACVNIGKNVTIHYTDNRDDICGICSDILPDGTMNVQTKIETINVNSGEVSVKGIYGHTMKG